MDILMELSKVLITETGDLQLIELAERDGTRRFPIRIGITEALAIDRRLKGVSFARPLTHDLLAMTIEALGGRLERIVVNDLRDVMIGGEPRSTFFAQLHIRRGDDLITIDARPSDAIALGVASDTPVYVAEHVLDAVTYPGADEA
ncbi:MAG: bifunctional nuclease family protein [Planctomycetota bacterium]